MVGLFALSREESRKVCGKANKREREKRGRITGLAENG